MSPPPSTAARRAAAHKMAAATVHAEMYKSGDYDETLTPKEAKEAMRAELEKRQAVDALQPLQKFDNAQVKEVEKLAKKVLNVPSKKKVSDLFRKQARQTSLVEDLKRLDPNFVVLLKDDLNLLFANALPMMPNVEGSNVDQTLASFTANLRAAVQHDPVLLTKANTLIAALTTQRQEKVDKYRAQNLNLFLKTSGRSPHGEVIDNIALRHAEILAEGKDVAGNQKLLAEARQSPPMLKIKKDALKSAIQDPFVKPERLERAKLLLKWIEGQEPLLGRERMRSARSAGVAAPAETAGMRAQTRLIIDFLGFKRPQVQERLEALQKIDPQFLEAVSRDSNARSTLSAALQASNYSLKTMIVAVHPDHLNKDLAGLTATDREAFHRHADLLRSAAQGISAGS
jgi:hypothetical protein